MRTTAAPILLAAALGGCYYDRPNPWDTSGQEEALQEKTYEDWRLELSEVFHPPRHEPAALTPPEVEAWRDTVLSHADGETLERLRAGLRERIAALEARLAELSRRPEPAVREQLRETAWRLYVDRLRLRLADERAARGAG
ncbi:MAG TPA: hypothetical protein VNO22_06075 [Planctomycetota bacterium]|nr:hypothetical protein [Planctomycetota bacterium]